jgi:hypothetical protein
MTDQRFIYKEVRIAVCFSSGRKGIQGMRLRELDNALLYCTYLYDTHRREVGSLPSSTSQEPPS